MTHTLHRRGSYESLTDDYPVLVMAAKGMNEKNAAEKLKKALELALQFDPVNYGDMKIGNRFNMDANAILKNIKDTSIVHAVYDKKENLEKYLHALKDANLGMSTVLSGNFRETIETAKKIGLCPHTALMSLGIFGKLDLLAKEEILEITTMCGHHMISTKLVEKMIEDVKKGEITLEGAGEKLAEQCVCGVFNPKRAARLISAYIDAHK